MADEQEQAGGAATHEQPVGAVPHDQPDGAATHARPNEEERSEIDQRAAYEAELSRITSSEMILQTTVSLLNIGGRRLGLGSPPASSPASSPAAGERDLEQVRDAIDGVRGLMPILERRMAGELGPLRDAVAQLQMAYAREVQGARETSPAGASQSASVEKPEPAERPADAPAEEKPPGPGPAQASGRLWVPGR